MDSSQIHLALTQVPVILSIVGLVVLVAATGRKNDKLTKTSYSLLLLAGLSAVPVSFTGEGVAEIVIERHEEPAKFDFAVVGAVANISLVGLLLHRRTKVSG
ncbi:MAG: hypothetical protein HYZ15_15925 [Sphingobacteriales bacterium]|nr:hypothetical protein [Sphingobacteriales bacterium]